MNHILHQHHLDILRVLLAGNLSFDVIDRLSGGTFNVPNPNAFVVYFTKRVLNTPCAFWVINLFCFDVVWMGAPCWLNYQAQKPGIPIVIRAQTDKHLNTTQLRRMLLKRKVRWVHLSTNQEETLRFKATSERSINSRSTRTFRSW
ncbi:hypothetical protein PsorP6_005114 [Peronosclerospora sorghi]|uniref:Uncharacterized protein n=1 Tax=Peronosclerospora sorghi TaxID=230839 RepID=A0ACC0W6M6_9STRA|nr:hypothetical protein PsorP6_005114 [Peronosclerospora sorghi]